MGTLLVGYDVEKVEHKKRENSAMTNRCRWRKFLRSATCPAQLFIDTRKRNYPRRRQQRDLERTVVDARRNYKLAMKENF